MARSASHLLFALSQAGYSLKVIQEAAGHKEHSMSARYAHMDQTTLEMRCRCSIASNSPMECTAVSVQSR